MAPERCDIQGQYPRGFYCADDGSQCLKQGTCKYSTDCDQSSAFPYCDVATGQCIPGGTYCYGNDKYPTIAEQCANEKASTWCDTAETKCVSPFQLKEKSLRGVPGTGQPNPCGHEPGLLCINSWCEKTGS